MSEWVICIHIGRDIVMVVIMVIITVIDEKQSGTSDEEGEQ